MTRLVRAELLKLRTTQVWFWLLLASVAIAVLAVVASIAPSDGIRTSADVPGLFAGSVTADVAVFVLGVLGITTEFRYQTITPTLLITPSRWAVVGAKMITYAAVGAAYSLVCLAVQLAIAVPWLSAKHIDIPWTTDSMPRVLLGVFAVVALHGLIGLGVGALLRSQIVAVSVGVIFLLVLQNIVLAVPGLKLAYPYLPAGGVASLVFTGDRHGRVVDAVHLFPPLGGLVVLVLWAAIPAVLGASVSLNRDIT